MSPSVFAGMFALSLLGAVLQAVCGFGYGPVNMSVLPYLLPYSQAVALSGLSGSTTALFVAIGSWRHINWKMLLPCEISGLAAGVAAVQLSAGAQDVFMVHCLGIALMALGVYSLFFSGKIRIKATFVNGLIAGTAAGLLSGFFAVGGPPMAIYLLEAASNNEEYRATLDTHFCITAIATTSLRWTHGVFTPPVLQAYGLILGALAAGTWIGGKIFRRLDARRLRITVYGYLIVSGALMLLR